MKKVVTHNSRFHADDVFSTSVLKRVFGEIEIIRTRDPELIASGDIIYDIGKEYDPSRFRFDHHQEGGAGERENGVPYAAFGLLWKEYGEKICGSAGAAQRIDERLVQPIDSVDNGVTTYSVDETGVRPYTVHGVLGAELPTWKEDFTYDDAFFNAVTVADHVLDREILYAQSFFEAKEIVTSFYDAADDKRVIVLDDDCVIAGEIIGEVLFEYPEVQFYIKQESDTGTWRAHTIRKEKNSFANRTDFPAEWGGKSDKDLAEVSGVGDAIFCHNKLFLAAAKSKESAVKMAYKALGE